jgi:hypothetical protein
LYTSYIAIFPGGGKIIATVSVTSKYRESLIMSISGVGGARSAEAWSGASSRTTPTDKFASLFDKLDTTDSGTVSKDQFTSAFSSLKMPASFRKAGADTVFSQLDPNNTGAVSKQSFVDGMMSLMKSMRSEGRKETEGDGDRDDFKASLASIASGLAPKSSSNGSSVGGAVNMLV